MLTKLNDACELGIEIVPDEDVVIDRSLDSSRLGHITGRRPPAWDDMVSELAADETPYEEIRRELAHR